MADIGEIINENASSRTITPAAVGSQVALMTIISVSYMCFLAESCSLLPDPYNRDIQRIAT